MGTIWKGAISFGLVNIPVRVESATRDTGPKFKMLHGKDNTPVKMLRIRQTDEEPVEFKELVKGYELVPEDWAVADVLTHGELGDVLGQLGVVYVPADPSKPVSQPFAEAILRRELGPLRDYYYRRLGHDITIDNLLDDGVRPAVSSRKRASSRPCWVGAPGGRRVTSGSGSVT